MSHNSITIHQVTYGLEDRGHSIIKSTFSDKKNYNAFERKMDSPFGVKPGISYEPFFTGVSAENYYLLIKTFPIESAKRSNTVFSHALVIDLEDITKIKDLNVLFEFFPEAPNPAHNLSPISLNINVNSIDVTSVPLSRLIKLANGLIESADKPTVWIGQKDFIEAVTIIWKNLLPENRKDFTFRLSLGYEDTRELNLNIVCTPVELGNSWYGYTIVNLEEEEIPISPEIGFMIGHKSGQNIRTFANEIGNAISFGNLKFLFKAARHYENLDSIDLNEAIALLRIIQHIAPENEGINLKQKISINIKNLIKSGTFEEINSLRNLPVHTDYNAEISEWVRNNVKQIEGSKFEKLLNHLSHPNKAESWNKGVLAGLNKEFSRLNEQKASYLWGMWQKSPNLITPLMSYIQNGIHNESKLLQTCPNKFSSEIEGNIIDVCQNRKWYDLHAKLLTTYLDAKTALEKQLAVLELTDTSGLELIIENLSEHEIIQATLTHKDQRLVNSAVTTCCNNPDFFTKFDAQKEMWYSIFSGCLDRKGIEFIDEIPKPYSFVHSLLDILISGENLDGEILNYIAKSKYNNLIDYSNRSKLWKHLPYSLKSDFLNATSQYWLETFKFNSDNPTYNLESELRRTTLSYVKKSVRKNQLSIFEALPLFAYFQELSEYDFISFLEKIYTSISSQDAKKVGLLINDKEWTKAYRRILFWKTKNPNLQSAIDQCSNLTTHLPKWIKFLFDDILSSNKKHTKKISKSYDKHYSKIKELLSKGNTKEALDKLSELIRLVDGGNDDIIVLISAQLSGIEDKRYLGTVSDAEYNVEINRINKSILDFVNDLMGEK